MYKLLEYINLINLNNIYKAYLENIVNLAFVLNE